MDTIDDSKLNQLLAPGNAEPIAPDHREWMNAQIKATLERKERGEMNYTPLNQVRRAFKLDAS